MNIYRFEWYYIFESGSCMLYAECIMGIESNILRNSNLLEFRLQLFYLIYLLRIYSILQICHISESFTYILKKKKKKKKL